MWHDFNPRPLAGATPWTSWLFTFCLISIHAPLRGRHYRSRGPADHPDFNPRPLAGATCIFWTSQAGLLDFNPRPLAGATPFGDNVVQLVHDFNPRPLAGATNGLQVVVDFQGISIHAPLRGRRAITQKGTLDEWYFNPRPLAGATCKRLAEKTMGVFQSTPPCGGDRL